MPNTRPPFSGSSSVPPTPDSSPTLSHQPELPFLSSPPDCHHSSTISLSSSSVPCPTPSLCHSNSVPCNLSISSSPAPARPRELFAGYDEDQGPTHFNAESHSFVIPAPSFRRSTSPASSLASDKLSNAWSDDSDLDDLASLAQTVMNIPVPVKRDDAARLLVAATDKKKFLRARHELAHSRLREARMQMRLCSWKAKHADHILHVADIHVSRICWVINKSGHQEILPLRASTLERLPVHQDGSVYSVDTINGRLEVVLD